MIAARIVLRACERSGYLRESRSPLRSAHLTSINPFRNFKSAKRFQNKSDVLEFWSLDNNPSKRIMDVLETIYLTFRKTIVQRVTVVKLGVYDGGGNCFGGVKIKVGTDTAKSTDVMVAGFRQNRDLIRE